MLAFYLLLLSARSRAYSYNFFRTLRKQSLTKERDEFLPRKAPCLLWQMLRYGRLATSTSRGYQAMPLASTTKLAIRMSGVVLRHIC